MVVYNMREATHNIFVEALRIYLFIYFFEICQMDSYSVGTWLSLYARFVVL